jgi:hypothetical protein
MGKALSCCKSKSGQGTGKRKSRRVSGDEVQHVGGEFEMQDEPEKRGKLIRQLEDAMLLAEELNDGTTTYLIERALDEARAQQFRPPTVA